jgi:cardiolipin synthase (CMP-forming)
VITANWLNVPNSITLFRLCLVPVFVVFELTHQPEWALACFSTAAISDGLDGLLARLLNQRTKLGGLLDPIADKVLIIAALVSLVIEKRLPLWLLAITAFRDLLMVAGALMVRYKNLEIPTEPSRLGKYATFFMVCTIILSLVSGISGAPGVLRAYVAVVGFVAALCVIISTAQYFARYGYLWVAPARRRPIELKSAVEHRDNLSA